MNSQCAGGKNVELSAYVNSILENIRANGLERYDLNDLDKYIYEKYGVFKNNLYRKAIRGSCIFFPIFTRKVYGIEKTINPATYYHLGMAYLNNEKYHLGFQTPASSQDVAEEAVRAYYQSDTGLWLNPSCGWVPFLQDSTIPKEGPRTMLMHCLARLNIFILALWRQYGREDLLDISIRSALAAYRRYNIIEQGGEMASISYYDNSIDNTLNINAEFLEWIADIPSKCRPHQLDTLGHKILKMLISEQNPDGSFFYFGKAYMKEHHRKPSIDNHHTAYTLKNLLAVYESDFLTAGEQTALLQCILRGMEYYMDSLFDRDGSVIYYIGEIPGRKAETVPYSEGILAFCAFLKSPSIPLDLKKRISGLLPKVLKHLLDQIRLKDGSAPSEYLYGRTVNINSIRWGNGPALQAILEYMDTEKKCLYK